MTRALNAARAQSAIIQQLFISSIVGFGLQLFCATWLITFAEDSAHDIIDAVLSTSLMIACGMYALRHAVRMDRDFHGEETQWAKWADVPFAPHALWAFVKELRASQQSRRESTRTPTPFGKVNKHLDSPGQDDKLRPLMSAVDHRLDNPLGLVEAHPDLAVAGSASVRSMKEPQDLVRPAICELQGPLRKRVSHAGLGMVDPHQWRDRYFVLSEGSLLYWPTEADFNHFIGGLDPNDSRGAARLSARLGRSSVYSGSVPEGRATQSWRGQQPRQQLQEARRLDRRESVRSRPARRTPSTRSSRSASPSRAIRSSSICTTSIMASISSGARRPPPPTVRDTFGSSARRATRCASLGPKSSPSLANGRRRTNVTPELMSLSTDFFTQFIPIYLPNPPVAFGRLTPFRADVFRTPLTFFAFVTPRSSAFASPDCSALIRSPSRSSAPEHNLRFSSRNCFAIARPGPAVSDAPSASSSRSGRPVSAIATIAAAMRSARISPPAAASGLRPPSAFRSAASSLAMAMRHAVKAFSSTPLE